jgi:hypothetical protein
MRTCTKSKDAVGCRQDGQVIRELKTTTTLTGPQGAQLQESDASAN